MKKMIVIAALIGGMLMPAQIMAQKNNRNEKPRIENRDNRKEFKADKKGGRKDMRFGKPDKRDRPGKGFAMNKPRKPRPRPVIINRPAPRPCPPPPPAPRRYYYDNDVADVAVTVLSLAALVALAAD